MSTRRNRVRGEVSLIDLLMLLAICIVMLSIPLGLVYGWRTFLATAASPHFSPHCGSAAADDAAGG